MRIFKCSTKLLQSSYFWYMNSSSYKWSVNYRRIIIKDDSSNVIDPSKIRRNRKIHSDLKRNTDQNKSASSCGIYVNGWQNKTSVLVKEGDKVTRQTVIEEHVVIPSEPGSIYFCHIILYLTIFIIFKQAYWQFEKNFDPF